MSRAVVIGASAGGVEALTRVVRGLPDDFDGAVFVVLHVSPQGPSVLPEILNRAGPLIAQHAEDGAPIEPGRIYIAPPNYHLLLKPGRITLTHGPRENNARPAVDPLFRTAARCFGPRTIGVVLSGGLDDGTAGLMEVKRRGGIAIAQRPDEALFPSMPQSAIDYVDVDRVLSVGEIGPAIGELAAAAPPTGSNDDDQEGVDEMTARECDTLDVAEVGTAAMKNGELNGPPSRFTCPECHGALWELGSDGRLLTYRCHVGHGYTAEGLMAAQSRALEEALWTGLRALEETAEMRRRMARRSRAGPFDEIARHYEEDAALAEERANVIRGVLVADNQPADGSNTRGARDRVARASGGGGGGDARKGYGRRTNGRKTNGPNAAEKSGRSGAAKAPRHSGEPVDPATLSDKPAKVTKGGRGGEATRGGRGRDEFRG